MEYENSMGLLWIFNYPNGSLMLVQDGKLSSCKRSMQSVSSEHLLQWCYLFFDISLSGNKILSDVCKMQQTKIKTTIIVKLFVKENWKLWSSNLCHPNTANNQYEALQYKSLFVCIEVTLLNGLRLSQIPVLVLWALCLFACIILHIGHC